MTQRAEESTSTFPRNNRLGKRHVCRTGENPKEPPQPKETGKRERTSLQPQAELSEKEIKYHESAKKSRTERHGRPPRLIHEYRLKQLGVSPFSLEIEAEIPQPGFHLPKFAKFDPKASEAYTHLIHFRNTISLYPK